VIAHRLSTVQAADQIVVLDRGRVAESGTHDELRQSGRVSTRISTRPSSPGQLTVDSSTHGPKAQPAPAGRARLTIVIWALRSRWALRRGGIVGAVASARRAAPGKDARVRAPGRIQSSGSDVATGKQLSSIVVWCSVTCLATRGAWSVPSCSCGCQRARRGEPIGACGPTRVGRGTRLGEVKGRAGLDPGLRRVRPPDEL